MGKIASIDELSVLMELLDEQDEQLYDKISENIQAFGIAAIPFLQATDENALDDIVISRIATLIHKIRFQNLYFELFKWATFNSNDLLKGFILISKYHFPDLDEESVMAQIEVLKKQVWLELNQSMTPYEGVKVLTKIFFEVNKYSLNTNPCFYSDSLCINTLLNGGEGHPTAFSVLYAGIAQRLGLPLYGINLPESIFLAYVSTKNHKIDFKNNVNFYLNPFAAGVFISNLRINEHLEKHYPKEKEEYTGACNNTQFILQVLKTMQYSFICSKKTSKTEEKIEELNVLMKALDIA